MPTEPVFEVPQFDLPAEASCTHPECRERKRCAAGHETCSWYGCTDSLHRMARGPGGWIPDLDDRPLGNTD
jgi:hypothetical protein